MNKNNRIIKGEISLNGSKSISNRILIIKAISQLNFDIIGLSTAKDTLILKALLEQDTPLVNVEDAGTACRFMTAYLACQNRDKKLVGSRRMHQRPIGELVAALQSLGATIIYENKKGFLPLYFLEMPHKIIGGKLSIKANVSSQFVSALLMIAPTLPHGIELILKGKIVSKPYIQMTINLMQKFGIKTTWKKNKITILPQKYKAKSVQIEADWSAASYYYSLVALSANAQLQLNGLYPNSIQGDAVLVELMQLFGVKTTFNTKGILLTKTPFCLEFFDYDFSDCPDIAQTLMVLCAALQIPAKLKGLETLTTKETNRLEAPRVELEKLGCEIKITANTFSIIKGISDWRQSPKVETYGDHRMAMSFAPLLLVFEKVEIKNPKVVVKSYPHFWQDMQSLGLCFL